MTVGALAAFPKIREVLEDREALAKIKSYGDAAGIPSRDELRVENPAPPDDGLHSLEALNKAEHWLAGEKAIYFSDPIESAADIETYREKIRLYSSYFTAVENMAKAKAITYSKAEFERNPLSVAISRLGTRARLRGKDGDWDGALADLNRMVALSQLISRSDFRIALFLSSEERTIQDAIAALVPLASQETKRASALVQALNDLPQVSLLPGTLATAVEVRTAAEHPEPEPPKLADVTPIPDRRADELLRTRATWGPLFVQAWANAVKEVRADPYSFATANRATKQYLVPLGLLKDPRMTEASSTFAQYFRDARQECESEPRSLLLKAALGAIAGHTVPELSSLKSFAADVSVSAAATKDGWEIWREGFQRALLMSYDGKVLKFAPNPFYATWIIDNSPPYVPTKSRKFQFESAPDTK